MTHYSTFEIGEDATFEEIKEIYKIKCLQYHPDKATGYETEFKKVQDAWTVLKDENLRREYDNQLQGTKNWK